MDELHPPPAERDYLEPGEPVLRRPLPNRPPPEVGGERQNERAGRGRDLQTSAGQDSIEESPETTQGSSKTQELPLAEPLSQSSHPYPTTPQRSNFLQRADSFKRAASLQQLAPRQRYVGALRVSRGPARPPRENRGVLIGAIGLIVGLAAGGLTGVALSGGSQTATGASIEALANLPPATSESTTTTFRRPTTVRRTTTEPTPTTAARAAAPPATATPTTAAPAPAAPVKPPVTEAPVPSYANCAAVRAARTTPILRGEPGFESKLDADNDGIGCEIVPD